MIFLVDTYLEYYLGTVEAKLGNLDRAIKHWTITASAGTVLPCMS